MKAFTIFMSFALATLVAAVPPFDPAGAKNVGNGQGGQFITGQCLSDADCASGCCAKPTGICSGPGASFQNGKEGCGFGGGGAAPAPPPAPETPPATSTPANGGPPFDPAGGKNVGNGKGGQFITGQCLSNADCGSGCCAFPSGICSGPGAAFQNGKQGCGFGGGGAPPAAPGAPQAETPAPGAPAPGGTPPSTTPSNGGPAFDPAGTKNVGNGQGQQFIGGQCLSSADCASGCCAGPSGICSGVGAQTQNGKTGCGFLAKRFVRRSAGVLPALVS